MSRVDDMVTGWERKRELADSENHIVPGHDPAVSISIPVTARSPPRLRLLTAFRSLGSGNSSAGYRQVRAEQIVDTY